MLRWFQAHMPKEERCLLSRADRGENDTQKMLVDMSTPPGGQAKGVGGATRRFG